MKTLNATGIPLPTQVQGLVHKKIASLKRPARKTLIYTVNAANDIFVIQIKLGATPAADRVLITNGNTFRITSAVNNIIGGQEYPTLAWKGGTPPFVIKLVYQSVDGNTQIFDVSGMCVNVNANLTDGTGDIVTGGEREYIVQKIDEADGWWADDLETEDLGPDEQENTQKQQNAIGLLIEDSSEPARTLFAPFAPDPVYDSDGTTPTGLFAKYPEGRFGPPTWCVPTVHWDEPTAVTYGAPLRVGYELNAAVYIPGTTTPLDGVFSYWLDAEHTIPAEDAVPNANTGLPLYVTFQATDDLHYHLAAAESGIVVNKALNIITIDQDVWLTGGDTPMEATADHNAVGNLLVGATGKLTAHTTSGAPVTYTSSNPAVATIDSEGNITIVSRSATDPNVHFEISCAASDNWLAAETIVGGVHTIQQTALPLGDGGVTFDINDSPIKYGQPLDVLCWSPIPGDAAYPAADGIPQGWEVDPAPGTVLDVTTTTPHSITAIFHPADTINYSVAEFAKELAVTAATPRIVNDPAAGTLVDWTLLNMTYGDTWESIMTAWAVNPYTKEIIDGEITYTVSGHSNSAYNGVIGSGPAGLAITAAPPADTGVFISAAFTPTGTYNYRHTTASREVGVEIKKAPQILTVLSRDFWNGGEYAARTQYDTGAWVQFQVTSTSDGSGETNAITVTAANTTAPYTPLNGRMSYENVLVCDYAGPSTVTVSQAGSDNFEAGSLVLYLTIDNLAAAPSLTWTPTITTITYGDEQLSFTFADWSGHINALAGVGGGTYYYGLDPVLFTYSSTQTSDGTAQILMPAGATTLYVKYVLAGHEDAHGQTIITVNKRAATITADAKSKAYGASDPALTYTVSGMYGSQTPTGSLARAAGEGVGTYAITQGTLSAGDNYTTTFTGAVLTITQASQTPFSNVLVTWDTTSIPFPRTLLIGDMGTISVTGGSSSKNNRYIVTDTSGAEDSSVCQIVAGNRAIIVGTGSFKIRVERDGDANYTAATPISSATMTVGVLSASITPGASSVVYSATPQPAPYTTTPAGITVNRTYNGSSTIPTAAGAYTVVATITDPRYSGTATWTFTIAKATPVVYFNLPPSIVKGTLLTDLLKASANTPGTCRYYLEDTFATEVFAATELPASTGTFIYVDFTPTDTANWNHGAGNDGLVVKGIPSITWPDPANIVYGTWLDAAQLNATANVPGTFTYSIAGVDIARKVGSAAIVLYDTNVRRPVVNSGLVVNVSFVPTDGVNFTSASDWAGIVVTQKTIQVAASAMTKMYGAVDPVLFYLVTGLVGNDHTSGALTRAAGENAGTYAITIGTVTAGANYTIDFTGAVLTITAVPVTLTLTNLSQIYNGSPKTVGVLNVPAGASRTVTYNGSTTPPVNAGSYAVVATLTGGNYTGSVSGTLVVQKATQSISFTTIWNPYGPPFPRTLIIGDTGTVSATGGGSGNPITITSSNPAVCSVSGMNLSVVGPGSFYLTISQAGDGNYLAASATASTYTVGKLLATIQSAAGLSPTYTGAPAVVGAVVTFPAGLNVRITYDGSTSPPINVGIYDVIITIVDSIYYGAASATLVISKATPILTWATPSAITYGRVLDATQLNATANVPGTYEYIPPAGTYLTAGANRPLIVNFTPSDTLNYDIYSTVVYLTVNKATPSLTWATPAAINDITPLSDSQLNASCDVPGVFTYDPPAGTTLSVGDHSLTVEFVPYSTANYNTPSGIEVWLTVISSIRPQGPMTLTYTIYQESTHFYVTIWNNNQPDGSTGILELVSWPGDTKPEVLAAFHADIVLFFTGEIPSGLYGVIAKGDATHLDTPITYIQVSGPAPASQAALTCSVSPTSIAQNGSAQVSVSGGSGTGAVTYWQVAGSVGVVDSQTGLFLGTTGGAAGTARLYAKKAGSGIWAIVGGVWMTVGYYAEAVSNVVTVSVAATPPPPPPVGFSVVNRSGFVNIQANFTGGSGAYTCTQVGGLNGVTVTITSTHIYLATYSGYNCYQSDGYFKLTDRYDSSNVAYLFFSAWFPNMTNFNPRIGACSGGEGPAPTSILGLWSFTGVSPFRTAYGEMTFYANGTFGTTYVDSVIGFDGCIGTFVYDPGTGALAMTWTFCDYGGAGAVYAGRAIGDTSSFTMISGNGWTLNFSKI